MSKLNFHFSDLYPGMSMKETSTEASPEMADQIVLNEDADIAEKSSLESASKKNVLLALGVLAALVVFFGGGQ